MVYDSPKKLEQLRRQTRDKKHIRLPVLIMLDEGFTHEVTIVYEDQRDVKNIDPIEMLLIDSRDSKNVNMLKKKVAILEREYGLKPANDLGIIRVLL